jgi:hypothetical protein
MQNILTQNYLIFRNAIGVIGIATPILLILLSGIITAGDYWIQPSISHYYYSVMHFLFLFILILLGSFLIFYKGNGKVKWEDIISTLAGISAFLVAIFPTEYDGFNGNPFLNVENWKPWFNYLHFGSAAILFLCFAYFCFIIFQKSDHIIKTEEDEIKKNNRNKIYTICGILILFSIIMIAIFSFIFNDFANKNFINYIFYFECVALWAFGFSWIIKGSELFKDFKLVKMIR